jgi:hypothetical protein
MQMLWEDGAEHPVLLQPGASYVDFIVLQTPLDGDPHVQYTCTELYNTCCAMISPGGSVLRPDNDESSRSSTVGLYYNDCQDTILNIDRRSQYDVIVCKSLASGIPTPPPAPPRLVAPPQTLTTSLKPDSSRPTLHFRATFTSVQPACKRYIDALAPLSQPLPPLKPRPLKPRLWCDPKVV